ncbi:hypothetical protein F5Y15DRAFT_415378 [Xylariaceae sp. FL0016]|nr:hypothetical protein F5Y15DRAFT_415378 [Xylariaceae sp. FL0016]
MSKTGGLLHGRSREPVEEATETQDILPPHHEGPPSDHDEAPSIHEGMSPESKDLLYEPDTLPLDPDAPSSDRGGSTSDMGKSPSEDGELIRARSKLLSAWGNLGAELAPEIWDMIIDYISTPEYLLFKFGHIDGTESSASSQTDSSYPVQDDPSTARERPSYVEVENTKQTRKAYSRVMVNQCWLEVFSDKLSDSSRPTYFRDLGQLITKRFRPLKGNLGLEEIMKQAYQLIVALKKETRPQRGEPSFHMEIENKWRSIPVRRQVDWFHLDNYITTWNITCDRILDLMPACGAL